MKAFLIENGFKGEIKENFSLKEKSFYQIGGQCLLFLAPSSTQDLSILSKLYQRSSFDYFIIGQGSNLLISDKPINTVIISLEKMPLTQESESETITLSANTTIRKLLNIAKINGYDGLEKLCGIPGEIGGSIKMNAGTHLGEICELLTSYEVFNIFSDEMSIINPEQFQFSYRSNSALKQGDLIIAASFKIKKEEPKIVQDKIYQSLLRRKESQPLEFPSCGSVFRNPKGFQAWDLIDKVGLRGHQIGQAQISSKHSNWIINLGGASSEDVIKLIKLAQNKVKEKFKVFLVPEVQTLGQFSLDISK